jgi:hypothetical protein
MFRPDPMGRPGMVELCGVQHLMPKVTFDTDKIMAKGSRTVGAFAPFPSPDSLMRAIADDSLAPIEAWLAVADKTKPLVICEGVATGLAIQQSGAGNTLCALSSNNVMTVAKWVKETGLSDVFADVVIATDHDIGRDAVGRLKSNAIARALEAAKVTGFALAVPPARPVRLAPMRGICSVRVVRRPCVTSSRALHRLRKWRKRGLTFSRLSKRNSTGR